MPRRLGLRGSVSLGSNPVILWLPEKATRSLDGHHRNTKGELIMRSKGFVFGALVLSVAGLHLLLAHNPMTFFITSKGPGDGANLGGLTGADKHCQNLATAA